MPQFDPTHFSSQIFWFFVCFGILWVFMRTYAWPKLKKIQHSRQETIDDLMEKTKIFHEEVLALERRNEDRLSQAKQEVAALIKKAAHDGQSQFEDHRRKLFADFQKSIEDLRLQIDQKPIQGDMFQEAMPELVQLCLKKFGSFKESEQ